MSPVINDESSVIVAVIFLNNAIKLNMALKAVENLQHDQRQFSCHRIRCNSYTLYTVHDKYDTYTNIKGVNHHVRIQRGGGG